VGFTLVRRGADEISEMNPVQPAQAGFAAGSRGLQPDAISSDVPHPRRQFASGTT
jgi:hypothetical protein